MTFPYMWQTGLKVVENELTDALVHLTDGDSRKARDKIERAIGRAAAIRREVREYAEAASDDEPGLNVDDLRELAHRELEIARLMGPSDELEQDWMHYLEQLVSLTDAWLARAGTAV